MGNERVADGVDGGREDGDEDEPNCWTTTIRPGTTRALAVRGIMSSTSPAAFQWVAISAGSEGRRAR